MATAPTAPRVAATVLVLRDGPRGPEVLMLRRHGRSGFAADAWVYPGGAVDDADCALHPARWTGIDPETLEGTFGDRADLILGFHVAAVRETFEEAGLLLARHADDTEPDISSAAYVEMRMAMASRDASTDFNTWLEQEDLVLELGRLTYLARWVTPVIEPKRFDTCFFLARAPEGQIAAHDRVETTDQLWVTAADALERAESGEWILWPPTRHTLRQLRDFSSVDAFVEHAGAQDEIRSVLPHIEVHDEGWRVLLPEDPDYPHDRYAAGGDRAQADAPERR